MVGEKVLGSYFIALSLVQKGYRRIELENSDGRKTKAGLLVKISIEWSQKLFFLKNSNKDYSIWIQSFTVGWL